MNRRLIVIDGKTYKNVEEMPEDVRRNYEQAMGNMDKDRNGIPDMLENANAFFDDRDKDGTPDAFEGMISKVITTNKIVINGREFNSLEDLPPEAREKFLQAMGRFDSDQNGMPDFLEGKANTTKQATNIVTTFGTETPRRAQPIPAPVSTEPDTSNGWMLALAGLFILLLCVAGAIGVWYFFLR